MNLFKVLYNDKFLRWTLVPFYFMTPLVTCIGSIIILFLTYQLNLSIFMFFAILLGFGQLIFTERYIHDDDFRDMLCKEYEENVKKIENEKNF